MWEMFRFSHLSQFFNKELQWVGVGVGETKYLKII